MKNTTQRFDLFTENCPGLNTHRYAPVVALLMEREMRAANGSKFLEYFFVFKLQHFEIIRL